MKSTFRSVFLTLLISTGSSIQAEDSAVHSLPDRIEDLEIPVLPFERNVAFASWILELNEDKVGDWLNQSTQNSWNVKPKTRKDFQSLLFNRLVELNPAQALEFALQRSEPNRSAMMTEAFQEWALDSLSDAIGRVKSLPSRDRHHVLNSVFISNEEFSPEEIRTIEREFAIDANPPKRSPGFRISPDHGIRPASTQVDSLVVASIRNPARVWYDIVEKARPNATHYQDLTDVATAWVNESGISALDEIRESLTDYEVRRNVIGRTLVELMLTMPEKALDFAVERNISGRTETIMSMVNKWARVDPIASLNRVHAMPSSGLRRLLEQNVIKQWLPAFPQLGQSEGNPSDILESLHLIPEELRGVASERAIQELAQRTSPSEAVEALWHLDEHSKLAASRMLLKEWLQEDEKGAIEWARTHPEIEDVRNEVLHTLVLSLAPKDPQFAFQIARELPTPIHGFGLEGELLTSFFRGDLDTAMELLPQVREGRTKFIAYVTIGTTLLRSGRMKESLGLGSQLPTEQGFAKGYYLRISTAWAQRDPQELLDEMHQFPTDEVRSAIAAQQIRWNSSTNYFSEEQIQSLRRFLTDEHQDLMEGN